MGLDPRFTAIPHTSSTLTIDWFAGDAGWQGGNDESWALDNVAVVLDSQTSNSRTVFATAFDGAVPPQFTGGTLESVQGYAGIGVNGDTFGGNFYRNATAGNPAGKTRLTLTGLPAHQTIDLRFLLAIIDSWEGSTTVNGPDRFTVTVDGQTRFSETFGSLPSVPQSYVPTPGVTPRLQGGQVVLTTSPTFAGTARITVTAADDARAGRTDTLRWDFTAGANAVYGSTFENLDRDGVRDPGEPSVALVPVFLDANGNNIADPGETLTYSDGDGRYAFFLSGLAGAPIRVVESPPDAWRPTTGLTMVGSHLVGVQSVSFTGAGAVSGVDFSNLRVLDVTGGFQAGPGPRVPVGPEGSSVSLTATVTDPNPANGSNFAYAWQVFDPSGQVLVTGTTSTLVFTPPDDGTYTATVTLTDLDDGNREYRDEFRIFATNVAPVISTGPALAVAEGATWTRTITFTDPGADVWTAQVNFGDASAPVSVPSAELADKSFDVSHRYADDGLYTLTVQIGDGDGGSASDALRVTVTDVAPTIALTGPASVTEGAQYTLVLGPVTDPGADTVTEYRVAWGDGSPEEIVSRPNPVTHVYLNDGNRAIAVTLVDEDGAHANAGSKIVSVQNVAPVLTGIIPSAVDVLENGSVTIDGTFSDPGLQDLHTLAINWGDGTPEQVLALAVDARAFSATHQYLDDDPSGTASDRLTVTVRVSDESSTASGTTGLTVRNVAPVLAGLALDATQIDEGTTAALTGSVADPGPRDTESVVVDWGDGSVAQPATRAADRSFRVGHRYAVPGQYAITTTVTDDDGGVGKDTRQILVRDRPPQLSGLSVAPVVLSEGSIFTRPGAFTDASTADAWVVTVDYGDGVSLPLGLGPGNTFELRHVFADSLTGPVTVAVTVRDRVGAADTRAIPVTVQNVAPTVDAGSDTTLAVGDVLTRQIAFTDPGADRGTALVDFRDGSTATKLAPTAHTFIVTHRYDRIRTFPLSIQVNRDHGGMGADSRQ